MGSGRVSEASSPRAVAIAYGLLLLTMLIWSSAFAGLRLVLRELDALTLTTVRMVIAGGALALVGAFLRVRLPARADWPVIAGAGLSGFTGYHLALNFGLQHVTAGQASFIIATTPIWTALLAGRCLGEHVSARAWVGLWMGVAGVGVLGLWGGAGVTLSAGALLVLFAALCAGMNMTLQKRLLRQYPALDMAIFVTLAGALPFLLYLPWAAPRLSALSPMGWATVIYLGLGPIALGYVLSTIALATLDATRAAQMLLLVPPLAAIIAWIWIDEVPGLSLLFGGALVLAGVLVGRSKPRQPPVTPALVAITPLEP